MRRKRAADYLALCCLLIAAACSAHASSPEGHAIDVTPNRWVLDIHHAKVGEAVFLAMPDLTATSGSNPHLVSAEYTSISPGLKVLGYRAYAFAEVGKEILTYNRAEPAPAIDPDHFKSLPVKATTLKAGNNPEYFLLAEFMPLRKGTMTVQHCRFVYEMNGTKYQQLIDEIAGKIEVTR